MSMQFYTAYFFIFSPYLGLDDVACPVDLDGIVYDGWGVTGSYGRGICSPRYDISINACSVDNVGDVDYYIDGVSYDSCGTLRVLDMSMAHIELDLMVIV